ncbi:MAG: hypothetical protein HOD37_21790, partial [Bacteroidetes bacterium]|nr:hypothetical protein [Bacteroidota bacterium]
MIQDNNANLINLIKDYLATLETDYAIGIDGVWGSGKSYFVNNILRKHIEKVKSSTGKYYKLVIVSLFGVSDPAEIQTKLFLELNPFMKRRWAIIGNMLLQKGLGLVGIGALSSKEKGKLSSIFDIPKNIIIVFDDFERLDPKAFSKVPGLLNQYIERDKLKVLIVGDFGRDQVAEFNKIREKLIRHTYEFQPNIDSFLEQYCKVAIPKNKQNILSRKDLISRILVTSAHNNLRTLKFFVDTLNKIESIQFLENEEHKNEVLDRLVFSLLSISIEYKEGIKDDLYSLESLNGYDQGAFDMASIAEAFKQPINQETDHEIEEADFKEKFRSKYLNNFDTKFCYLSSMVSYITTGLFDKSVFRKEIQELGSQVSIELESPESKLVKRFGAFFYLSDEELNEIWSEICKKVNEAVFSLYDYAQIFSTLVFLEREKIKNLIDNDLIEKFKTAIWISVKKSSFDQYMRQKLPIVRTSDSRYDTIIDTIEQANKSLHDKNIVELSQIVAMLIETASIDELDSLLNDDANRHLPIFDRLKPAVVYNWLHQINNEAIMKFRNVLFARYPNDIGMPYN